MHLCCLILVSALAVYSGVIQGAVLEWASGKPLSRTLVHLQPVPGSSTATKPLQTRSGRSGQFVFGGVPDGQYILYAQREGFLIASHGQRRPTGHGRAVIVNRESSLFAELRMHRMGALTGTVLDENGVGIPRAPVIAYRAKLPLRVAGRGVADDRGIYRISGLELGKHWVRSGSHILEDGTSLLPMFGPEAREPRDALLHEVRFDDDTPDANIRPEPGRLLTLSGVVACDRGPGTLVSIILSSETTRKTTQAGCAGGYSFGELPPGMYEIFGTYADGTGSGFAEVSISQDVRAPLQVVSTDLTTFQVVDAGTQSVLSLPIQISGRRDDLSGGEPMREIPFPRAALANGHWEFMAAVGPGQYVERIQGFGRDNPRPWRAVRPPEAFPVFLVPYTGNRVRVLVSQQGGQLGGRVVEEGRPSSGIPVFLWPVREETRRQLGGPRETMSDIHGNYLFTGLPPGAYRVVATVDTREMTEEIAEEFRARTVSIEAGQQVTQDLGLWLAP